MNILNNSTEQYIQNRQGSVNILGNQNVIHIKNSQLHITVNGNNNRFIIQSTQLNIQVNGNNNKFSNKRSNLEFGFNGSGNQIFNDPTSVYKTLYCNGTNNVFPNSSANNRNSNQRQQRNPQNQNRNRRNEQRPRQRYQFQPVPQYIERQERAPRQNRRNQYNFQAQQPRIPAHNIFQGFPFNGNFLQQLQMMMPNFNANQLRRNRRPTNIIDNQYNIQYNQIRPRRAVFVFNGEQSEEEQKGLTMQQFNLLPTSNHVGKIGNCTICLQDIRQGEQQTYLICFHAFHPLCIRDWIMKNAKCPVCQFDLKQYFHQS